MNHMVFLVTKCSHVLLSYKGPLAEVIDKDKDDHLQIGTIRIQTLSKQETNSKRDRTLSQKWITIFSDSRHLRELTSPREKQK